MKVTEKKHDEAVRTLRAEYYGHIKEMGDELLEEATTGTFGDESEFWDRAHETIDGSRWTFITHMAHQVVFVSDSSDAYEDEGFEIDFSKGLAAAMTQIAYWAQMADLRQYVEATLSVDYDDADLEELIETARG